MKKLLSTSIFSILFLLASPIFASQIERADDDNLTWDFAKARKQQIRSVEYRLHFNLKKGSEEFEGKTTIDVELLKTTEPLSIDFTWKEIRTLTVNGKKVSDYVKRTGSLDIPSKYLKNRTKIEFDYVGAFNKEGQGFQRSIDPEDQSEYLFTDFEPNYAHTLFPSFDQPDLKATFRLSVEAPTEWKIVGNGIPNKTKSLSNNRTLTEFPESKKMSTYLFFLGAGPYVEWNDKEGQIPISIYARKTLAKYVDHEKLIETSKKGLRFYQDYFGYEYPFPKFGLIFIPEFSWGGMENPGAIAINEKNIFRGPVPTARMEGRDGLILHEMAHMWFGDLVTTQWWNDLWLNESFATYLATIAQVRALGQEGAWVDFFSDKTWGYWQDQLVTTHPIETQVSDVRSAKGNFDGITYAKGGATLKQLHFFVGEDGFREGLRNYFSKYAFKNTTRENFLAEIAATSKKDLKNWTEKWLQTSGPQRVQANLKCKDGKIDSFMIVQEPSVSGTLSPHRTKVALFSVSKSGEFNQFKTEEIAYSEKNTIVPSLKGLQCPDFVYPNFDDQDYALFSLDPVSIAQAGKAIEGGVKSPLLRLMVWNTLGQMVRDGKLTPKKYFEAATLALSKESDEAVLGVLLGRHTPIAEQYDFFLSIEARKQLAPHFEEVLKKRVFESAPKSSVQMAFFDFWVRFSQTPKNIDYFSTLLDGSGKAPNGIEIDQDRRWALISTLAKNGHEKAPSYIASEEKKDPSTSGKKSAYVARASIPTKKEKENQWTDFMKPEGIPASTLKAASKAFHHPNYPELSKPFLDSFFKEADAMDWKSKDSMIDIYFEGLFPSTLCTKDLLNTSEAHLQSAKNLTPLAKRAWLEANDELGRCVQVRKAAR